MPVHFTDESMQFLVDLEHNNERPWFLEHKPTFDATLKAPLLNIIDRVNDGLEAFAPDYLRPPEKAMFRIYRDVRFAKDKTPYKTHVGAFWPRQGQEKTGGGGFYLQISSTGILIAGGAYQPRAPQLASIRDYVLKHHVELATIIETLENNGLAHPMDGNPLIRPPRGYPADHPAIELLKKRSWAASAELPAAAALQPNFADLVVERFRAMLPLVAFLGTAVHDGELRTAAER
ncbi:DUF2461 domain-containing protein [Cryobacterium sp. CG_9.6]|uniref:DUF2461 domain-containing protein n=1 Tax=Cryobacterium sp. CG_9.6 TaxID=2760710 RepID=UPI002473E26A|nr:DUF2461 domain-containing protein [Cryobacterium sp. CG_9.6]MDH6236764.1 uncharacterized protein (TIGR02453 family) [Cryobacterium sp. CG_9.6]